MEKHTSYKELILLGNFTPESLDSILYESSKIHDMGMRIDFLSRHFLEIPYQESTLRGDINTQEVFVINLEGIDCFTFLDYVESMRLSSSFSEFKENLKKVRYRRGEVSFENRNHFFTDWPEFNSDLIDDLTEQIGGKKVIRVKKILNEKEDGTLFLQGIQPRERLIHYIPANTLDDLIINALRTGDYIGIYSTEKGLDVSHVGIFIQERDKIYLRHASSLNEYRKVIDQGFKDYIAEKLGIIVFRSRK
jgi:hypothetical protein